VPREVIVAQLIFAITSVFYATVLAIGCYKDLGEESNKTEWRIKPLLYEGNLLFSSSKRGGSGSIDSGPGEKLSRYER
jgi:hypothetical protein